MRKTNYRTDHYTECMNQTDEKPCICDKIEEQERDEYTDGLVEDALLEGAKHE